MIARIAATKESKTLTRLYKLYDKKYYIISQYNISNKIYFNKICLISCFFFWRSQEELQLSLKRDYVSRCSSTKSCSYQKVNSTTNNSQIYITVDETKIISQTRPIITNLFLIVTIIIDCVECYLVPYVRNNDFYSYLQSFLWYEKYI